jgi:hypothetical protein
MKLPHRRQFLHLAAGAAALPAFSRIAWAQAYPSRPVRRPGGFGDERRLQCFNVVWKCAKTRIHATIESQILAADS